VLARRQLAKPSAAAPESAALDRALEAADGNDVGVGGGAATIQQCLRAGLIDETPPAAPGKRTDCAMNESLVRAERVIGNARALPLIFVCRLGLARA